jgi:hypothetical protein
VIKNFRSLDLGSVLSGATDGLGETLKSSTRIARQAAEDIEAALANSQSLADILVMDSQYFLHTKFILYMVSHFCSTIQYSLY